MGLGRVFAFLCVSGSMIYIYLFGGVFDGLG